ncbi:MAG: cyclopropane-fatty-acyl-phospholipid synthase family protein [Burkholderiales bacterium]
MKTTTLDRALFKPGTPKPHFLDGIAEFAVRRRLSGITHGALALCDGSRIEHFGKRTDRCPFGATLRVHDPRFYSEIAFGGSIGAGEAYMQGYWSVDDLTVLMRVLLQNREVLDGMETGLARLVAPLQKILHWTSRNTRNGSRRNIHAHYDLGNEFFQLFLDPTMMYSSAIFERPAMTLEEASIAKLDRICRKLELKPGDRVMEIGTGWGGFAIHAARHYGCHVTTTTISPSQHALARTRVAAAGLTDSIDLQMTDYRDLTGQYDKLVSIEMIEAVGHQYYGAYFRKCSELLKPEGMMLLQAITIADQRYEAAKKSVDFIQRYIFPGSCIPSVTAISDAVTRVSDMRLFHLEDIGPHYATTLRQWRENLHFNIEKVRALGYPAPFIRMWEFYLCYCEAGFMERVIGDVHMLLVKPQARPVSIVPPLTNPGYPVS